MNTTVVLQQIIRHDAVLHRFRGKDTYHPMTLIEIQAQLRQKLHANVPIPEIRRLLATINDPYLDERDYGPVALEFLETRNEGGLLFPNDPETAAERDRMTAEFHKLGYRGIGNTFVSTPVRLPYLRNLDNDKLGCMCETRRDKTTCNMSDQCRWSDEYNACGTLDEDGDLFFFH